MLVKKEKLHFCQKWRNCPSLWEKNELADNQIRKFPDKSMTFLQISKIPWHFPKFPDREKNIFSLTFPWHVWTLNLDSASSLKLFRRQIFDDIYRLLFFFFFFFFFFSFFFFF